MSQQNMTAQSYRSADEIEAVAKRFESLTLGPGEFRHREHLAVILWYLTQFSIPEAAIRMREQLYKFLDHHGHHRQKYHETITIFWVKRVSALLNQGRTRDLAEVANEVMHVCSDAKLINDYYSPQLLTSAAAREEWVEPDLQPLDFYSGL